jgi:hypothetical protein
MVEILVVFAVNAKELVWLEILPKLRHGLPHLAQYVKRPFAGNAKQLAERARVKPLVVIGNDHLSTF